MALISGTDAKSRNTYWNSRITDKAGTDRGNSLLSYIAKEKLFVENVGDEPTFDNGCWTNSIDLTLANAKGSRDMTSWADGKWQAKMWMKTAQITTSSLIIYHLNLDLAKPNSETLPKLIGKFTRMN